MGKTRYLLKLDSTGKKIKMNMHEKREEARLAHGSRSPPPKLIVAPRLISPALWHEGLLAVLTNIFSLSSWVWLYHTVQSTPDVSLIKSDQ